MENDKYAFFEVSDPERELEIVEILRKYPKGISFNKLAKLVKLTSRVKLGDILGNLEKMDLIRRTPKHPRRGQRVTIELTETINKLQEDLTKLDRYYESVGVLLYSFEFFLSEYENAKKEELVQEFLEKFPIVLSGGFVFASTLASRHPHLKGLFFWKADQIMQSGFKQLTKILQKLWKKLPSSLKDKPNLDLRINAVPELRKYIDNKKLLDWFEKEKKPSHKELKKLERLLEDGIEIKQTGKYLEKAGATPKSIKNWSIFQDKLYHGFLKEPDRYRGTIIPLKFLKDAKTKELTELIVYAVLPNKEFQDTFKKIQERYETEEEKNKAARKMFRSGLQAIKEAFENLLQEWKEKYQFD